MKIVKKINNNVAIGLDGNQREVILFGKGVGFGVMPYELNDMTKVDRTFYDIDPRYYGLLTEISEEIFLLVTRLIDIAKMKLDVALNSNLAFVLADHINFAVAREQKGMDIPLSYSYELEYEYPELTKVAKWFISQVNDAMHTHLPKGEVTSVTVHFLNAMESEKGSVATTEQIDQMISDVTAIVENCLNISITRDSFYYFRFKNHLKFYIRRKKNGEEFSGGDTELYKSLQKKHPDVKECVKKIDDYLEQQFCERCPNEELMYLMIHVAQLYGKEDCNH